MSRHADEIEADFAQFYPAHDLGGVWTGALTWRKASVLAMQLPAGARIWQATGGARAWSDEFAGLMVVEQRIRHLIWTKSEDAEKGKTNTAPKMIDPPEYEGDVEAREKRALSNAEKFAAMQARLGA